MMSIIVFVSELPLAVNGTVEPEIDSTVKKKWDSIFLSVHALLKSIVLTVPM